MTVSPERRRERYRTDPVYRERILRASREAKRKRTGICEDCGGPTRYNGGHGRPVSLTCNECSLQRIRDSRIWTRDTIIEAIQRWARIHGEPPIASDWGKPLTPGWPPINSIYRHRARPNNPFDTWASAIEAAGFTRPRNGIYRDESKRRQPRHPQRRFDRDAARALRASGLSYQAIGDRLGVTDSSIWVALHGRKKAV